MGDIERLVFGPEAWSPAMVTAELSSAEIAAAACSGPGGGFPLGDPAALVAEVDGEVVGYVLTGLVDRSVELRRIGVLPSRRRRGVGRALLSAVLAQAAADGGDRVLLEVSDHNLAALGLYTAAGFEPIARRRRYYRDGSDAVVLGRVLDGAVDEEITR